jgi:flagellar protein FlbD
MIELTRLNGNPMHLNSDLIKTAEASPDTVLTLINGEKLIVREELREVIERVLSYRAALLAEVARRLAPNNALSYAASLSNIDLTQEPRSCNRPDSPRTENELR